MTARDASDHPADAAGTDLLVEEIEETRTEMAGTLGEIGDRLEPGHLIERAKENVREATIGRVEEAVDTASETAKGMTDMVIETIRKNPIPAAIAGVGLALLWKNRSESGHRDSGARGDYGRRFSENDYRSFPGRNSGDAGGIVSQAGDRAGEVAKGVGDTVGRLGDTVGQTADEMKQRGQDLAGQGASQFGQLLETSPLALGAIAIGAGVAVGVLVPETPVEQQVLHEPARRVGELAQDAASQAMDKVEEAADKVESSAQSVASS